MKTHIWHLLVFLSVLAILIGSPGIAMQARFGQGQGYGGGGGGGGGGQASLNQAEIDGLLYMREEEKLAHDAYVEMYAKYGLSIFSNISSAETNHMAAVKNLLDRYGLPDPASGNGIGVFTNPTIQGLYDALTASGNQSLIDALLMGGMIEEVDIHDLETYLTQTSHTDISNVYTNLKAGSCNHLRAFASQYTRRTGLLYEAQFLSQTEVQVILNGGC